MKIKKKCLLVLCAFHEKEENLMIRVKLLLKMDKKKEKYFFTLILFLAR